MEILIKDDGELKKIDGIYLDNLDIVKAVTHPIRVAILRNLAKKPYYPKALARKLKIAPQKLQYHFKKLEQLGLIEKVREERISGSVAQFYKVTPKIFPLNIFGKSLLDLAPSIPATTVIPTNWISYFVKNGRFDAKIIVGSPDLHGPYSARSRDSWCAAELSLFLGRFVLTFGKNPILLDTAVDTDDLKQNLILIGGPITNTITARVNKKLPLYFEISRNNYIIDRFESKQYTEDNLGIVALIDNPFSGNNDKKILVCAGRKMAGTRAAVLALVLYPDKIPKNGNFAILVESVDKDSDGIVDDVAFLRVWSGYEKEDLLVK